MTIEESVDAGFELLFLPLVLACAVPFIVIAGVGWIAAQICELIERAFVRKEDSHDK